MLTKIAFILHGKIRRYPRIISHVKEIFNSGYDLNFYISQYAGHSIELSSAALKDGASHIIAVGGDGTLNEVVNGVMNLKNEGLISNNDWNKIRIGLLPKGTGNDFAKTINVSYDLKALEKLIEADSHKQIDLGLAAYLNRENKKESRYFINIIDLGIGGLISSKLAQSSKLFGALSYQAVIISSLIGYKYQPVKVKADNFEFEGEIMNFIVANGKYFGAGLGIAPYALPDDGIFSVVIVQQIALLDYLVNLRKVRKCLKIEHPELKYMEAKQICIKTESILPIDMDGEFIGYAPLEINIVPKVLSFIVP